MNALNRKLIQQIDNYRKWAYAQNDNLGMLVDKATAQEFTNQAAGLPPTGTGGMNRFGDFIDPGLLNTTIPDVSYADPTDVFNTTISSDFTIPGLTAPTTLPNLLTGLPGGGSITQASNNAATTSLVGVINSISQGVNTIANDVLVPIDTILNAKIKINTLQAEARAAAGGATLSGASATGFTNELAKSPLVWAGVGLIAIMLLNKGGRRR